MRPVSSTQNKENTKVFSVKQQAEMRERLRLAIQTGPETLTDNFGAPSHDTALSLLERERRLRWITSKTIRNK